MERWHPIYKAVLAAVRRKHRDAEAEPIARQLVEQFDRGDVDEIEIDGVTLVARWPKRGMEVQRGG